MHIDPLANNPLITIVSSPGAAELRQQRLGATQVAHDRAAAACERWGLQQPTTRAAVERKPSRPGTSPDDYLVVLVAPLSGTDRATLFDGCPVLMVSNGCAIIDAAVLT